jgi:ribosomal protein L11 methyltransferase
LSDILFAAGAFSVSVEDAEAGTAAETPQFGEPGAPAMPLWRYSRVIALFEPNEDIKEAVAAAKEAAGLGGASTDYAQVEEQDWVRLTQAQFEPIRINDRLWIVPSWHQTPDPAAINITLDPGLAFGTGSHPTTRLCLEWLCEQVHNGDTVLDYGCGSGILALAAAKLGAADAVGVDVDEHALTAAADNAAKNGVALRLIHSRQPLTERFSLVVANILTNPLCLLAPLISARVAPGGRLALAGVLESQADQVIAAYAPHIRLTAGATLDGWVRLEGRRP